MQSHWINQLHPLARKAGRQVMEKALVAYFVMVDPVTPKRAKLTLLGALAYFVFPVDVIPDFIPVVGFADDAGAIAWALMRIASSIRPRHHEQAQRKLVQWGLNVE